MTQFDPRYEEVSRKLEELLNRPNLFVFGRVDTWLKQGALPEEILEICPRVAKQGFWRGSNLNYFDGFIADAIAARTKPMPAPRAERTYERKGDAVYTPRPELPEDIKDKIDKGLADMINKGLTVMSVTYQDAARFHKRGWLTPAAAERFGL
jgi:hypothetical protein